MKVSIMSNDSDSSKIDFMVVFVGMATLGSRGFFLVGSNRLSAAKAAKASRPELLRFDAPRRL